MGAQLLAGQAKWEVPGRKPDTIPRVVHGGLPAVAVCLLLLMEDGTLESHVSIAPHFFCTPEPLINRRCFGLDRGPQSQGRLKTQNPLEGVNPVEE